MWCMGVEVFFSLWKLSVMLFLNRMMVMVSVIIGCRYCWKLVCGLRIGVFSVNLVMGLSNRLVFIISMMDG